MHKSVKFIVICILFFQICSLMVCENTRKAENDRDLNQRLFQITAPTDIDIRHYAQDIANIYDPVIYNQQSNFDPHIRSIHRNQSYEYVIISTEENYDAITLSNFISWKTTIGYNVKIVNITDDEIQLETGLDLPQKIRNFLRNTYLEWNTKYALIIADHTTIPMRYCYPNPANHEFDPFDYLSGEVPTDYYYADLTAPDESSWDYDGDGFFGEYGEDFPDFKAEVFVGRIPTDNPTRVTYTLNKTVAFEQDTGDWKRHALNAGAFYYFTDEGGSGNPSMDGAVVSHYIEQDAMDGWVISHYSEQEGLETSVYPWSALTEQAFTSDWRTGQYAIVNWQAHGWTNGAARKVWTYDDGDGIPEGTEISWPYFITMGSNLDDDYPSIVTALSCYVGCPESSVDGNIGIDLLTDMSRGAAIGVIASARSPYGSYDWTPLNPGGSESIIYEFNRFLINYSMKMGQALYESKYFCNEHYGWDHYVEFINLYTINLFGDPALTLEGIRTFYADYSYEPEVPITNETIVFTDMSVNLEGVIVNWSWNFGDGTTSFVQHPIHHFQQSGVYSACLTIEDDQNRTDTICKDIIVLDVGEVIDANQMTFDRGFPIRHAIDGDWGAAQSFIPTVTVLTRTEGYMRKFGTPEFNLTVELREDHPQGSLVDTLVFTPEDVGESFGWFPLDFADTIVESGVQYFIVIPPAPSGVTTSFGYEWGYAFGNHYDNGAFWFTRNSGALWRNLPTMYEFCFRTYGYS